MQQNRKVLFSAKKQNIGSEEEKPEKLGRISEKQRLLAESSSLEEDSDEISS